MTTVVSSSNPSTYGQLGQVTIKATVTADGSPVTSGMVTFKEGSTVLAGPMLLNALGWASFSANYLSAGSHTVTAEFSSSDNFNPSSGRFDQIINRADTTTFFSCGLNPSTYGLSVSCKAAVYSRTLPNSGTVTFKEGSTVLSGPVPLNDFAWAYFSSSHFSAGIHIVTAEYSGSDNFNPSQGGVKQSVNPADTITTVTSSLNPSHVGRSVTFTATVASVVPGLDAPTGAIQFHVDGTSVGAPVALSGGVASLTTSSIGTGHHEVAATYLGNASFNSSSGSVSQQVVNAAPAVAIAGPLVVDEGSFLSLTASATDPDGDVVSFAWDLDGDGFFETPGQSVIFDAAALDGPSTAAVSVRATDVYGASTDAADIISVANVAPTLSAISAPTTPVALNTAVSVSVPLFDPSAADTHTAVWNWGDGSTSEGAVVDAVATGSHSYSVPGVFTVTATVTDDDGDSGQAVYRYVVAYDASSGFVTGSGQFDSPAGAYVAAPAAFGKATFGFVARYQKGADTPSGTTRFELKFADFSFHSTSYQWLAIAGDKAMFKGEGNINGASGYAFLISATDASPDQIRLKIWELASQQMVYDNQAGVAEDITPATVLTSGNVVIHR
jgi:hypothetical protein